MNSQPIAARLNTKTMLRWSTSFDSNPRFINLVLVCYLSRLYTISERCIQFYEIDDRSDKHSLLVYD